MIYLFNMAVSHGYLISEYFGTSAVASISRIFQKQKSASEAMPGHTPGQVVFLNA